MADWIHLALRPHFHLGWNLFLALVPLALAWWLFRHTLPAWLALVAGASRVHFISA